MQTTMSFEDLNDDLQVEILCRLPFRHLMRCKCVSKRWLSLISNPNPGFAARQRFFSRKKQGARAYVRRSAGYKKMLMPYSDDPAFNSEGFSLNFLPCYQPTKKVPLEIVTIAGDLFLCCASNVDSAEDIVYYICNPSTKQWVSLPPTRKLFPPVHADFTCESPIHLIREYYEDPKQHEGITCSFKVVRLLLGYVSSPPAINMDIFSSDTGQWMKRKLVLHPSETFSPQLARKSLICNGTVCLQDNCGKILLFNLISAIQNDDRVASDIHHDYQVVETPKANLLWVIACQRSLRAVGLVIDTVRVLYMWDLKENWRIEGDKWSLVHRVPSTEMVTSAYQKGVYTTVTILPPQDEEDYRFKVLDFQPDDENIIYRPPASHLRNPPLPATT